MNLTQPEIAAIRRLVNASRDINTETQDLTCEGLVDGKSCGQEHEIENVLADPESLEWLELAASDVERILDREPTLPSEIETAKLHSELATALLREDLAG